MQTKFEAYIGNEPYLFAGYSHIDTAKKYILFWMLYMTINTDFGMTSLVKLATILEMSCVYGSAVYYCSSTNNRLFVKPEPLSLSDIIIADRKVLKMVD